MATGVVCLMIGFAMGGDADEGATGESAAAETPASETDGGAAEGETAADEEEAAAASEEEPDDEEPETEPEPEPEPEPEGPATSFGPGTYLVGEDIAAGEYRTDGGELLCYWSRNQDASGELDAIIANDMVDGPGRVTINDGEYFETNGCDWDAA